MIQQYDDISLEYDLLIPEPKGLFEYYSNLTDENHDVLDIGCGSGRLAFTLAEKGANVHAIDISSGMVEIAKQKLRQRPDIQSKIIIDVSNVTEFTTNKKFDLILMTGGVFEYLLTPNQQRKALHNIKNMLKPNGRFVFDIISPPQVCPFDKRKKDFNGKATNQDSKKTKIKSWNKIRVDNYKQIVVTNCFFEVYDHLDHLVKNHEFEFISRYSLPTEITYLLEVYGFKIDQFYGDYDKSPFTRGSEFMVFETSLKGDHE